MKKIAKIFKENDYGVMSVVVKRFQSDNASDLFDKLKANTKLIYGDSFTNYDFALDLDVLQALQSISLGYGKVTEKYRQALNYIDDLADAYNIATSYYNDDTVDKLQDLLDEIITSVMSNDDMAQEVLKYNYIENVKYSEKWF